MFEHHQSVFFCCFFYQIAFEGIKGVSGFVALDDIEYTPGVNCDGQRVDPKPGETHRCLEHSLYISGLIHTGPATRVQIKAGTENE